ncbi:FAD/NAD(P)-binding domain-containing protein [Aspergillus welwitschiae]|uniref:FAD/NAD(P)-binding domain-containing protein n=1 Tax=Aspergillus welwitschiae TaxID=1341132 RepID=A0A3F3PM57_9EURO|nr:FAD/NAD(P)-binding domain-containing protein [Aspergillus welwitschiae]RDH27923.1 FAD/NAD(P)-binding domain-containing protein [Aspergillus welwitschiae]
MKRVAIVGAGPCGLVALKEMLQAGLDATIYESSNQLGGLFATAMAYPNLHLTISNWAMAFSDFPDPSRMRYSTAGDYLLYLQDYARHFDLERHIRYRSEVCKATRGDDKQWNLSIKQTRGDENDESIIELQADALIVATGGSQVPNDVPSQLAGFEGKIIHSNAYDEYFMREVAEKKLRVLIVGGGESGADISADLCELSPNLTVWLRRPPCVGIRYLNRLDEMQQMRANQTVDFPVSIFLEAITTNRLGAAQNVYLYSLFRRAVFYNGLIMSTRERWFLERLATAFLRSDQSTVITKSSRMCQALDKEKLEALITPFVSVSGRTCEFSLPDGTRQRREFDAILLCHGFRLEFPWLQLPDGIPFSPNPRSWFLHCFPEGLGDCLFFLGYARPGQGGIPPAAEMLSRYIALLLRDERQLPTDYAEQAQKDEAAEREYYYISPEVKSLVDYNAFMESVARRIGCETRMPLSCVIFFNLHILTVAIMALRWFSKTLIPFSISTLLMLWVGTAIGLCMLHDGLILKWWLYPHWGVWYRYRGPGANPALLTALLTRLSLRKSIAMSPIYITYLVWFVLSTYIQRLLSISLFVPSAVLSALGVRFPEGWGGLLRPKLFVLHGCEWRFSDLFLP